MEGVRQRRRRLRRGLGALGLDVAGGLCAAPDRGALALPRTWTRTLPAPISPKCQSQSVLVELQRQRKRSTVSAWLVVRKPRESWPQGDGTHAGHQKAERTFDWILRESSDVEWAIALPHFLRPSPAELKKPEVLDMTSSKPDMV